MHCAPQRNYSIDTLKLICSLLVVFIHNGDPFAIDIINRIAVPCFFVISGYFLYRTDTKEMQERLIVSLKNICIITLWSTILYFAIALYNLIKGTYPSDIISIQRVLKLLLFNSPIWGFHLWYLFAYIYTLIAIWIIYKFKFIKLAYCAIPILLAVSVFGGLYSTLLFNIEIPLICTRNFLFVGIPYFLIGALIKSKYDFIFRHKNYIYLGLIASIILSSCEYILNPRALGFGSGDLYLTTAPLTIAIFLLALTLRQTKDNIFSRLGRNDSLYIYIFHPATMIILSELGNIFLTEDSLIYGYYKWSYSIMVFLCTIIISVLFRTYVLPIYNRIK